MSEPIKTDSAFSRRIEIDDLEDPRLRPYWNLKERTLRGEAVFIAEGVLVVERLLSSPYETVSILTTRKDGDVELQELLDKIPPGIPVYYVDDKLAVKRLVGFEFHQGVMALGRRAPFPTLTEGLADFFSGQKRRPADAQAARERRRRAWVTLPDATKPDNLGLAFRCAAALDAEAVILGERCCDPFSRRALRVSMGGVLQTPIYQSKNLLDEVAFARKRWGVPFVATVLDEAAKPLDSIPPNEWAQNEFMAFVFGNEYTGLSPEWVSMCDRKAIIPMRGDVDSLNLGVSVGIFLYEFNRWN